MPTILEIQKEVIETFGFWTEQYKEVVIKHLETMYKEESIKGFRISDIVLNDDTVLIKWSKKFLP